MQRSALIVIAANMLGGCFYSDERLGLGFSEQPLPALTEGIEYRFDENTRKWKKGKSVSASLRFSYAFSKAYDLYEGGQIRFSFQMWKISGDFYLVGNQMTDDGVTRYVYEIVRLDFENSQIYRWDFTGGKVVTPTKTLDQSLGDACYHAVGSDKSGLQRTEALTKSDIRVETTKALREFSNACVAFIRAASVIPSIRYEITRIETR